MLNTLSWSPGFSSCINGTEYSCVNLGVKFLAHPRVKGLIADLCARIDVFEFSSKLSSMVAKFAIAQFERWCVDVVISSTESVPLHCVKILAIAFNADRPWPPKVLPSFRLILCVCYKNPIDLPYNVPLYLNIKIKISTRQLINMVFQLAGSIANEVLFNAAKLVYHQLKNRLIAKSRKINTFV